MATIRELTDYYVARMASIYRSLPKASNNVALYVKQFLADNLISEFQAGFDIDLAVGKQLDILGKYIGAPRDVGIEDTRPFFGFVDYDYPAGDQNPNGFVLYESLATNSQGIWYEYGFTGQATTQLTDFQYRQLMKLKISTNSTENTMDAIQNQIADFFPGQLQLRDNLDMSITYYFGSSFQLPLSVLEAYLPRPMGVLVTAVEAIGFDVTVDGIPAFNSETPNPSVAFGSIQFSSSKTFVLTNAKTSSYTVIAVAITEGDTVFTVASVTPTPPVARAQGEELEFVVTAQSTNPITDFAGVVSIFLSSAAGLQRFDVDLSVSVSGVTLDWIAFDNFDDYPNGPIASLNDSWGWDASGVFTNYYLPVSLENFEEYANGSIALLNGGFQWGADGIFTVY